MDDKRLPPDDSVDIGGHSDPQCRQSRNERDLKLAKLAARQQSVVARWQLLELGLTRDDVRGRLERGLLHPIHRGVYAVGHPSLSEDGRLRAALLACGRGAFISHRTAAAHYGLRPAQRWRLDVTTIATVTSRRRRAGIVLHRTTREPQRQDVRSRNGIRIASVPRTLIDLAATEPEAELTRMITVAVRRRLLVHEQLEATIARSARVPGIANLRAAYAAYRPRPDRKSGLERAFDLLLERHPEVPPAERNVHVLGWEVDYYWPARGVVLELDGRPYHVAVADIERDRLKDAKLLAAGIQPLRVTDRRFELEPAAVIGDLVATLTLRADGVGPLADAA